MSGHPVVRVLLDTSVLVPALYTGHLEHGAARLYLDRARAGEIHVSVSTHALAETYATLTALPVAPRLAPADAERLIQDRLLAVSEVVPLDADDYSAVLARVAGLGLASGAVYDALHVRAAEKAGCDEVVTFNGRDFRRFPPAPPTRLVVL